MGDKLQLYKYKGNRCSSCGMKVQDMIERYGTFHRMFEFHHVNADTKSKDYNNIIRQNISAKQLEEIDKCVLLCRQCHGILHAQNITAKINLKLEYEDRTVSQEFSGQIIYDAVDNHIRFISEEKILLNPYILKKPNGEEELLFGVDLARDAFFQEMLSSLKSGEFYEIFCADSGRCMMRAAHTGNDIQVNHNVGFSFLEIEAKCKDNNEIVWYRNGVILTSSGDVITTGVINYTISLPISPKK